MDDALSIDTNLIDNGHFNNQKQLFDMEWSGEHETILIDWADKAMCYRWLHAQSNAKFASAVRWFTIPVIIISTLTGTANFAQERVSEEYISLFVMTVGALNLIAGIITTVAQFLKLNELNESHRVSSIGWDKFYRNIKIELAKNPRERIPVGQMIKLCKEEFDRLMETSPVIGPEIITKFNKTFKNKNGFNEIKKPEICDDLVTTEIYRYVAKEVTPEKTAQLKKVVLKTQEMLRKVKKIKEFCDKFRDAQGRIATKDEIMESIKDTYIEFESMNPADIERHVERYLEEQERNANENVQSRNVKIDIDP